MLGTVRPYDLHAMRSDDDGEEEEEASESPPPPPSPCRPSHVSEAAREGSYCSSRAGDWAVVRCSQAEEIPGCTSSLATGHLTRARLGGWPHDAGAALEGATRQMRLAGQVRRACCV